MGLGVFRAGHHAGALLQLDARLLPKAEAGGVVHQPFDAQLTAHIEKEVVARDLNRLGHIDRPMLAAVLPEDPALGAIGTVVVVLALVPNHGGGGDNSLLLQPGHGGQHLKGGAGGIGPLKRPIQKGL